MSKQPLQKNRIFVTVSSAVAAAFTPAVSSLLSPTLHAQAAATGGVSSDFNTVRVAPVVVSGARSERANEDVPAVVTVITAQDIENKQIQNIKDLAADEPAVTVRRQPARFSAAGSGVGRDSNAGFNIRGIDGNRVLIQVDGIRVPNAFSFGATNVGRGDYVDVTTVSRVEILRGPASALYGSDGLAGAVSFFTREPAELLRKFGGNAYASVTGTYATDDKSTSVVGTTALRADRLDILGIVSHRKGNELESFGKVEGIGGTRTAPNPANYDSESGLVKWVYRTTNDSKLNVTLEQSNQATDTDVLTGRVPVFGLTGVNVSQLLAFDKAKRSRGTVQYVNSDMKSMFADRAQLALYAQDASTQQRSYEFRSNNTTRIRDQRYEERVIGLSSDAEKRIEGVISHRLVYGVDVATSEFVGNTEGTLPPRGETFPTKRFPDTKFATLGIFAQDEIGLMNDRLLVIPAIRYDRYSLKPEASVLFPSGIPAASSDAHVSPKLGFVWKFAQGHSVYTNLAAGFKAPTPNQVNQGFTNQTSFYQSIANSDLKPEKNQTVELGIRKLSGAFTYEAAIFAGRYRDFIEQVQVGGNFSLATPALFQFVNLSRVRLQGGEAKLRYSVMKQLSIGGGFAYTDGEQETDGIRSPLNSVNPLKAVASLAWQSSDTSFGSEFNVAYSAVKRDGDITQTAAPPARQFATPAWTNLDASAYWQFHRNGRIVAAIKNITNKKYWQWADVQGQSSTSTTLDAYTQPGRSYSLSLKLEF